MYKWLSPDKITGDTITIQYVFTDWSASAARADQKRYPQQRVMSKEFPLWSTSETEHWIKNKIEIYQRLAHAPQEELPECTEEELWTMETKYKYYKNPDLWGVIAQANHIGKGTLVIEPGIQIRIPTDLSGILNDLEDLNK